VRFMATTEAYFTDPRAVVNTFFPTFLHFYVTTGKSAQTVNKAADP